MEKIIQKALSLAYPKESLSALNQVINATPNPIIATEILLGLYVKPVLPTKVKDRTGVVKLLKNRDDWRQVVTYSYLTPKRIGAYYPKGTDEKSLNDNNWESLKCKSSNDDSCYLYFTSKTMEERQSECSYEEWLNCENLTPQRQFEELYKVD